MRFLSSTLVALLCAVLATAAAVDLSPSSNSSLAEPLNDPPSRSRLSVKKRAWVPSGKWFTGLASRAESWPKRSEMENVPGGLCLRFCIPWWTFKLYPEYDQGIIKCPESTWHVNEGPGPDHSPWMAVSHDFLNHHGSLRKVCGKGATIRDVATNSSIPVEIRGAWARRKYSTTTRIGAGYELEWKLN
ncbi:hypothetical protein JCM10212_005080 [Sporobolomyces blumeae]